MKFLLFVCSPLSLGLLSLLLRPYSSLSPAFMNVLNSRL